MSARTRREDRRSTARSRAEQRGQGFSTTMFKMPEGMNFWQIQKGTNLIDIVGYTAGRGNPFADPGVFHFERTFYVYNKVGADQKRYIAPGKTANQRDYIQEWVQEKAKDKNADQDLLKSLKPKERQIFLVHDRKEPDKGLQLFEFSFHKFGDLLDTRIKNSPEERGWDLFYYPDEDGFSLELTVEEEAPYGLEVKAIDFIPRREPLPDKIANHGICLDDMLIILPYEKLKARFLMLEDDADAKDGSSEPRVDPDTGRSKMDERQDGRPQREERQEESKKEEPAKKAPTTAAERGIERSDEVRYQGKVVTVVKISPDGTSLTLMDPETDEVYKAIGCDDVQVKRKETAPAKEEPKKEEPKPAPKEEPKQEKKEEAPFDAGSKKDASAGDDDWDSDWN